MQLLSHYFFCPHLYWAPSELRANVRLSLLPSRSPASANIGWRPKVTGSQQRHRGQRVPARCHSGKYQFGLSQTSSILYFSFFSCPTRLLSVLFPPLLQRHADIVLGAIKPPICGAPRPATEPNPGLTKRATLMGIYSWQDEKNMDFQLKCVSIYGSAVCHGDGACCRRWHGERRPW